MKEKKLTKKFKNKIENAQRRIFKHVKESGCTNPEECGLIYSILLKLLEGYK